MKRFLPILCATILSQCTFAVSGAVDKSASKSQLLAGSALVVALATIVILHQQPAPMPPVMPSEISMEPDNECIHKTP